LFDKFKIYKIEVENQLERKIKNLYFDRGGEYMHLKISYVIVDEVNTIYDSHFLL